MKVLGVFLDSGGNFLNVFLRGEVKRGNWPGLRLPRWRETANLPRIEGEEKMANAATDRGWLLGGRKKPKMAEKIWINFRVSFNSPRSETQQKSVISFR